MWCTSAWVSWLCSHYSAFEFVPSKGGDAPAGGVQVLAVHGQLNRRWARIPWISFCGFCSRLRGEQCTHLVFLRTVQCCCCWYLGCESWELVYVFMRLCPRCEDFSATGGFWWAGLEDSLPEFEPSIANEAFCLQNDQARCEVYQSNDRWPRPCNVPFNKILVWIWIWYQMCFFVSECATHPRYRVRIFFLSFLTQSIGTVDRHCKEPCKVHAPANMLGLVICWAWMCELYQAGRDYRPNRCAIVGNSGKLRESTQGSAIDSADFVLRFNSGRTKGKKRLLVFAGKTPHHPLMCALTQCMTHVLFISSAYQNIKCGGSELRVLC